MGNLDHPIFRTTLGSREKNELISIGKIYIDEKDITDSEREELNNYNFKLGDKVLLSQPDPHWNNSENPYYIIDVMDITEPDYPGYLIDLEQGGDHVYGWLDECEFTHYKQ